jgi:aspartate kinase
MSSVELARRHNVKLHIRSAFTWEPGTIVEEKTDMEQAVVNAITHDVSEAKVTVSGVPDQPGIAARMFTALAADGINVDVIVQNTSEHGRTDISFTVGRADLARALRLVAGVAEVAAVEPPRQAVILRVNRNLEVQGHVELEEDDVAEHRRSSFGLLLTTGIG